MSELLAPPVGTEVDLSDFQFMPLFIERLKKSKAWLRCKRQPELAFFMLNLWMRAWHERPAGSIEDDDDVLADAALADAKRWERIKADVLKGWIKASDGRLYHPVVVELVTEAWQSKQDQRQRTEAARQAKLQKRLQVQSERATDDVTRAATVVVTGSITGSVTEAATEAATGNVTSSKGQGQGEREGKTLPLAPSRIRNSVTAQGIADRFLELRRELWGSEGEELIPRLTVEAEAEGYLADGASDALCLETIERVMRRWHAGGKSSIDTLRFFRKSMHDAIAEGRQAPAGTAPADPDAAHRANLQEALKRGKWFPVWGPGPWEDSYPAKHILGEFPAEQVAALKPPQGVPEIPTFLRRKGTAA